MQNTQRITEHLQRTTPPLGSSTDRECSRYRTSCTPASVHTAGYTSGRPPSLSAHWGLCWHRSRPGVGLRCHRRRNRVPNLPAPTPCSKKALLEIIILLIDITGNQIFFLWASYFIIFDRSLFWQLLLSARVVL